MIKEAMLYRPLNEGWVECYLCAHRCQLAPGKWGICGVRENREGKLFTHVYGEVIAANVDPIEKKPLYHFYPGSKAFSIATIGCNFRCPFCQNWEISQIKKKERPQEFGYPMLPEKVVKEALRHGCRSISYTYTEPTIFFEFAYETAVLARKEGLANNFVTNGFMTPEAVRAIQPYLDGANIDLKAFKEETYKKICKARLAPVLETIKLMRELGIWIEVTTLVVPGLNDSEEELRSIARFLLSVDPEIPWHISRFHPDYEYTSVPPTPLSTLRQAAKIGEEEGLKFIYLGNVWGEGEDTFCPRCHRTIIRRHGFWVDEIALTGSSCRYCGQPIPGRFE
ncbi:MAG: AmmeMemoRadiSam system radical SAM enzyme [Candidatus Aminicenantes bacterium]|nr:AmmeMemoRadiSam system radical SAM enzyme [Candidatus Aminicenantes bacterium]